MRGVPKLLRRKADNLAYVTYRSQGRKRFEYFGPFGSERSRTGYADFVRRWNEAHAVPQVVLTPSCHLLELVDAHLAHAKGYYVRADGSQTTEPAEFARAYQPLLQLYPDLKAADFRPRHFKAVRQRMLDAEPSSGVGRVVARLSLGVINQRMGRIRRLFWWAVSEDLLEPAVAQALSSVRDLPSGRGLAPETDPVQAVPWEYVDATLPFLSSDELRAIVLFQWWAGTRPGEACQVRGVDLFKSGPVPIGVKQLNLRPGTWAYRCMAKMAHARSSSYQVYAIGPQARELLAQWLRKDPNEYLWQSRPGKYYQTSSYAHAVRFAAIKAGVPHWHPHQIRHSAAQRVEKLFGADGSRKLLGHTSVDTSLGYLQRDLDGASEIAEKLG